MRAPAVSVALALAACGPMPVSQAERICRDEAAAPGARLGGEVRLGATFGPEGPRIERRMDLDLTVTHRTGGEEASRACILHATGRPPGRPYAG